MPNVDLSERIPPEARWLKVHFEMTALKPGAELIGRIWSGLMDEAVVIKGAAGDAFIKMNTPQKISYQKPVNVDLKLRVVAYKVVEDQPE